MHTTLNHPVWSSSRHAWVTVGDLGSDDILDSLDASSARPTVSARTGESDMWDLTVATDHDFFVTSANSSAGAVRACSQ